MGLPCQHGNISGRALPAGSQKADAKLLMLISNDKQQVLTMWHDTEERVSNAWAKGESAVLLLPP